MAKIPRIDLGDRPSGIPDPIALNTTTADMIGSATSTSAAAMNAATTAALRERKRLAEAMEAKQRIVDASDIGQLTTRFESHIYKLEDDLHQEFAQNPAAAVDEYIKRAREILPQNVEAAPNDRVKLGATQGNESAISSGVARMHSWVSQQQTRRIKGNLALDINEAANNAAGLGSAQSVEGYAARITAKLTPMLQATYSPEEAIKEIDKLNSAIANRYGAAAAKNHPLQFSAELTSSSFLKRNLSDTEHAALSTAADKGYMGLKDKLDMDQAKEAFASGEKLAGLVGAEEFVSAAAAKTQALTEQKKFAAIDPSLKPADRKAKIAQIDRQLTLIESLKSIAYKQADITATDDPKELQTLWTFQDALFGKKAKKSAKSDLSLLVDQQERLITARDSKQISYGNFKTLFDDVSFAYKKAIEGETDNTSHWFFWQDAREAGNAEINRRLESSSFKNLSEDQKTAVRISYIRRLNAATNKGTVTKPQATRIALEALSLETGKEIPGVFK